MKKGLPIAGKTAALLLGWGLGSGLSAAQSMSSVPDIVRVQAYVSRDGVRAGESFQVAVVLTIRRGWHIHGPALADELLIPTTFVLEDGDGHKVKDYYLPPPKSARFDYTDAPLLVYEKEVVFGGLIVTGPDAVVGPFVLKGTVRFQACDKESCQPPREIPFELPFAIVSAERVTAPLHPKVFAKIVFDKRP